MCLVPLFLHEATSVPPSLTNVAGCSASSSLGTNLNVSLSVLICFLSCPYVFTFLLALFSLQLIYLHGTASRFNEWFCISYCNVHIWLCWETEICIHSFFFQSISFLYILGIELCKWWSEIGTSRYILTPRLIGP